MAWAPGGRARLPKAQGPGQDGTGDLLVSYGYLTLKNIEQPYNNI